METPKYEDYSFIGTDVLGTSPQYNDTIYSEFPTYMDVGNIDTTPSFRTVEDLRRSALASFNTDTKSSALDSLVKQMNSKISIHGGFSNINETHDRLNDGSFVAKYDTFMKGVDNNKRLASQQSNTERFFNSFNRSSIKFVRGAPLDIVSTAYGLGSAVLSGRLDSLYDNDFAKWVDDLDKKTDNAFTNYYLQGDDTLTNPIYAIDKILGGAEFTLRMLGSEALMAYATGGTSISASLAKYSMKALAKADKIRDVARVAEIASDVSRLDRVVDYGKRNAKVLKNLFTPITSTASKGLPANRFIQSADQALDIVDDVNNVYDKAKMFKTARFAVTGSAYEAGFEARHFEHEAEQTFWDYHRANGTEPTTEEMHNFYDKLESSANWVFGANMALLSTSNLAIYGNMLKIKNPLGNFMEGVNKKVASKFFGQGVTKANAEGVVTALKPNMAQKVAGYVTPIFTNALTEGVYEEGGQGIASGMFKNYVASAYDPVAMRETSDYMSSFNKALNDQFTTKEGVEEMIIGGIIGGLFGSAGSIPNTTREYKKQETVANVLTYANQNKGLLYSDLNLASMFANATRTNTLSAQLDKAIESGEITEASLKHAEGFISLLEGAFSVGKEGEVLEILKAELKGADAQQLSDSLGINIESVEDYKKVQLEGIDTVVDTYKKSRQFAENIFGGSIGKETAEDRGKMISGLSYAMTMGKVAEMTASNLHNGVRQKILDYFGTGEIYSNAELHEALAYTSRANLIRLQELSDKQKSLKEEAKNKAKELSNLTENSDKESIAQDSAILQNELEAINLEINKLAKETNTVKNSIISDIYAIKKESMITSDMFDDFQEKIDKLNEAVGEMNNQLGGLEIVKAMEEFNRANQYYKGFSEIVNSFTNPELNYKTYNHLFSSKRTKNKDLNQFTLDFFEKVKNVKKGYEGIGINDTLKYEIDTFSPNNANPPTRLLRKHIKNKIKNNEVLTEKETQIAEYLEEYENSLVSKLEVRKLKARQAELEAKINNDSENARMDDLHVISELENDIATLEAELEEELNNIDSQMESLVDSIRTVEEKISQSELEQIEQEIGRLETLKKSTQDKQAKKDLIKSIKDLKAELKSKKLQNIRVGKNTYINQQNTEAWEELELKRARLKNEYEKEIEYKKGLYDNYPVSNPMEGLTESEISELISIRINLNENSNNITDIHAENEILMNELYNLVSGQPIGLGHEKAYLTKEIESVEKTLSQSREELINRQSEIDSEMETLKENEESNLERLSELEKESTELLNKLEELKNPITTLDNKISEVDSKKQKDLENSEKLELERQKIEDIASNLESEIAQIEEDIKTYENSNSKTILSDLTNKLNSLRAKRFDMVLDLNEAVVTSHMNDIDIDLIESEIDEVVKQISEESKLVRDNEIKLNDLKLELEKAEQELAEAKENLKKVEVEIQDTKNQIKTLENEKLDLEYNRENYASEDELNNLLNDLSKNTDSLLNELSKLEKSKVDIEFYIQKHEAKINELNSEISDKEAEIESLKTKKDATLSLLNTIDKKLEDLYKISDDSINQNSTDVEKIDNEINNLKEKRKIVFEELYGGKDISSLIFDKNALIRKRDRLQKSLDSYNNRLDSINNRIETIQENLENNNDYKSKLESEKEALNVVKSEIKSIEDELETIYSEYELLTEDNEDISDTLNTLLSEFKNLEVSVEQFDRDNARLGELTDRLNEVNAELAKLDLTIESIKNLDKFYHSEIKFEKDLNEDEQRVANEIIDMIRVNNLAINNGTKRKINPDDSLSEQIKTFIENNPIFSNESSPYYTSAQDGFSMTTDEMNELETLKQKADRTEEENERISELQNKADSIVIKDNLIYDGVTLGDLMEMKKQAEDLEYNTAVSDVEVNKEIFETSVTHHQKTTDVAFSSEYVSLVFDNAVGSRGFYNGVEVTKMHNLKLGNVLGRYFAKNPNAELQMYIETDVVTHISEINASNYEFYAETYDNYSGLIIEFENGEKLLKPVRSEQRTGSAVGYTGDIADFGLTRVAIEGSTSKYDALYEDNSTGGKSVVKSDFEITVGGIPIDVNLDDINSAEAGDEIELVYLPDADYSIDVEQDVNHVVIAMKKGNKTIGFLKSSENNDGKYNDIQLLRQSVVDNGRVKVKLSTKYVGLPNIELDSNGQYVTHDVSNNENLGYVDKAGNYIYLNNNSDDVNTSFMTPHEKAGAITPFVVIEHGEGKYAFPVAVSNEITDMRDKLTDILNSEKSNGKKVIEINNLLNANKLYNEENQTTSVNINDSTHIAKLMDALENSEELVMITNHDAFRNAKKSTMINVNQPFHASKYKIDIKSAKLKPNNVVAGQTTNNATSKQGAENANNSTC